MESFRVAARDLARWLLEAIVVVVIVAVLCGALSLWFYVGNELDPGCPSGMVEADDGRCY